MKPDVFRTRARTTAPSLPRTLFFLFCVSGLGCSSSAPTGSAGPAGPPSTAAQPTSTPPEPTTHPGSASPLYVDPADYDFAHNPELAERIAEAPHRYFRFINVPFSRLACRELATTGASPPQVILHGDAHLEQYVVTERGRGLTDYDDASYGPAGIDLLRFATSIRLAARQNGWRDAEESLVSYFLAEYRATLADPTKIAPEPSFAVAMKAEFDQDRSGFLSFAESVMLPFDTDSSLDEASVKKTMVDYATRVAKDHSDLPASFFEIKKTGLLRVGIGSALDRKFLIRIEGPTADPLDDPILEVKEVRRLESIPCIDRSAAEETVLTFAEIESDTPYNPEHGLGRVVLPQMKFWVHEWSSNYKELKLHKSLSDPDMLREILADVAVQLARGHARSELAMDPGPHILALDQIHQVVMASSNTLADETESAHEAFVQALRLQGLLK